MIQQKERMFVGEKTYDARDKNRFGIFVRLENCSVAMILHALNGRMYDPVGST